MNLTNKQLAKLLKCPKNMVSRYLSNYRFAKYITSYRPLTFSISEEFIADIEYIFNLRHKQVRIDLIKELCA